MSDRFEDLPIEIRERVFSFTREADDSSIEVADEKGAVHRFEYSDLS